jgi:AcrR family transcriptional regulator
MPTTQDQGEVRPVDGPPTSRGAPSRRKEKRWGEILEAAGEVIGDKGFGNTKLGDIAEQLGVRQQALYYYVASKDELIHAVLRDAMERALRELDGIGPADEPGPRLAALLRRHVELTVRERVLFRTFYEEVDSLSPPLRAELQALERQYSRVFLHAVRAAIASGALPAGDPRVLTGALLGMATWMYRWAEGFGPEQVDAAVDDMLRLVALDAERRRG